MKLSSCSEMGYRRAGFLQQLHKKPQTGHLAHLAGQCECIVHPRHVQTLLCREALRQPRCDGGATPPL